MKSQKNLFLLRFINALFFITLIFIQYNSSFSLKISTANPMIPLALLVAVCMFCSEISGSITGLIVGIFIDASASTPAGFNALVFMILGLATVLVVKHLFNNNVFSAIALCILCAQVYFTLRWLCCIAFYTSFAENLSYIFNTVIPSCLYTTVFVIPLYFVEKLLFKKFYK